MNNVVKHSAKRLSNGTYSYRGIKIEKMSLNSSKSIWLIDGVSSINGVSINTLRDAKKVIDAKLDVVEVVKEVVTVEEVEAENTNVTLEQELIIYTNGIEVLKTLCGDCGRCDTEEEKYEAIELRKAKDTELMDLQKSILKKHNLTINEFFELQENTAKELGLF